MRDLIKTSSWQICKYKLKESPVTLLSQGFWVSETETSNRFVVFSQRPLRPVDAI